MNPLKPDLRPHQRRVGHFLREWSSEIDSLIAAAPHIRGAVERRHNEISDQPPAYSSNCASWRDPEVHGRQFKLTAVSILLPNRAFLD